MKKLLMLILVLMTGFNCLNASENNGAKKEKPEKRRHSNSEDESSGQEDNARSGTPVIVNRELLSSAFKPSPKRDKLDVNDSEAVARFRIESNLKAKQTRRMSNVSCNETNLDGQYTEISGSCETTPKKVQVRQIIKSNDSLFPPCLNPIYFNVPNNIYETPVKNQDYQSDVAGAEFIRSTSQLSFKESSNNPTPTSAQRCEVLSTPSSEQQRRSSSNQTPLIIYPGNAPLFSDNLFLRSQSVASMTSLPLSTTLKPESKKEDANAIDENDTKLKKEETFGFDNDEEDDSDIDNNCFNNYDETK